MDKEATSITLDTFKEVGIDLVVTLPEEPSHSVPDAARADPYFTTINAAGEGNGIALCAGASIAGRDCVFVTGIAGLLNSTWALSQMGMVYGAPIVIMASYRGDLGDHSGVPGSQLLMFKQAAEPLLTSLRIPYRIVERKSDLRRSIREGHRAAKDYESPIVLLLTGELFEE